MINREKSISTDYMLQLEKNAQTQFCMPALLLMENAGRSVCDSVVRVAPPSKIQQVLVLAGSGNNGGDGYVAARHLHLCGWNVDVCMLGKPDEAKPDAFLNWTIADRMNLICDQSVCDKGVDEGRYTVIIDALFGTGLNKTVSDRYAYWIDKVNKAGVFVYAIDVPSGIDSDTGEVMGIAIKADVTGCLAHVKRGVQTYKNSGELYILNICIPSRRGR